MVLAEAVNASAGVSKKGSVFQLGRSNERRRESMVHFMIYSTVVQKFWNATGGFWTGQENATRFKDKTSAYRTIRDKRLKACTILPFAEVEAFHA